MILPDSAKFNPFLITGERILWSGKPVQGISFSPRDILLVPFSLLWGGFAVFWNYNAWSFAGDDGSPDLFFQLWGLPFLLAGLYFIAGRFFHDALIRKNQLYEVTDRRILFLRGSKFSSLDIRNLDRLDIDQHRGGKGTIKFSNDEINFWMANRGLGEWTPGLNKGEFFRITDAQKVYQIIRDRAFAKPQ